MSEQKYTATLSPGGSGRSGWCVIFRHPIRLGPDGKPGLRIRRGLGTPDRIEAQRLVDQANVILGDPALWTVASKAISARRFDERIVSAFYDDIVPSARDGWVLRDEVIHLPSSSDGYTRALLLGTTGAGKTTLVRQLIGTGGENEKFPSISAAKTTTCDIEIVLADDNKFTGVVSFLTQDQIRQYIEECVCSAILSCLHKDSGDVVARRFLEHSEQRFRLNYLLGGLPQPAGDEEPDEELDIPSDTETRGGGDAVGSEERKALGEKLRAYLNRVYEIAEVSSEEMESTLGISLTTATQEDRDTFEELLEDRLREQVKFHALVDDMLDDIESRFDRIPKDTLKRGGDGWPTIWKYSCPANERTQFIRAVNYFASNQAILFGRLLTPLVEGIRVRGPFTPSWDPDSFSRLVLMDGEGLGHAVDTSTSVSTRITKRYQIADVILLVDSASQPMLAAPVAALRSLLTSGQQSKLVVAFTHLDQVVGDNLPNEKARRRHIKSSLDNVISALGTELGRGIENALQRILRDRTFFLHNLQEPALRKGTEPHEGVTVKALADLLDMIRTVGKPPAPTTVIPVYDDANLVLCIQRAVQEFRDPWRARLGIEFRSGLRVEHWTRIKALTRRLGLLGQDEYDNLRPVADFIGRLQERIHPFLKTPLRWEPMNGPPEMETQAIDFVAREVSKSLHEMANDRLVQKYAVEWQMAYAHRGFGSATARSRDVETIYDRAAPIPGLAANANANQFLLEVRLLIRKAITAGGGKLVGIDDCVESVESLR